MKLLDIAAFVASMLAVSISAGPITGEEHQPRQLLKTSYSEFTTKGCNDIIMFYARGSDQWGNIGETPGPALVTAAKRAFGRHNINVEGVKYGARLISNTLPGGCDPVEAAAMADIITRAANHCPDAQILVVGYSLGAAMVHRSIQMLSDRVKDHIAAAVTFGDTQNSEDGGRILFFDTSKTLILCNDADLVCQGLLIAANEPAHQIYEQRVPEAVRFMESRVYG